MQLVVYTPQIVRFLPLRLSVLERLVDIELSELNTFDGSKALVNNRVSLNRLAVLHTSLNTLLEKALNHRSKLHSFESICDTYLTLVSRMTQLE